MNEAVHNDSDDESHTTNSLYMATSITSHSHFHWILDGGSTTHICKDISAFSKLAPLKALLGVFKRKDRNLTFTEEAIFMLSAQLRAANYHLV